MAAHGEPPPARTRTMQSVDQPGADTPAGGETTVVVAPRLGSDTDPGFRLPEASRLPQWLPYAVALAALAIVVLLVARSCGGGGGPSSTSTTPGSGTSATSDSSTARHTIDVAARDYLGRPVADVRSELVSLGLKTQVTRSEGGGVVGTVKNVSPTGTVDAGTTIALDVVDAPAAAPAPGKHDKPKPGKGPGPKKGR
jgi:serine/threonine-protein kinase